VRFPYFKFSAGMPLLVTKEGAAEKVGR